MSRADRRIPDATVVRLPVYLRILGDISDEGTVSSDRLADLAGVNAAKVRKDLSYVGTNGVRGVGYQVDYLVFQIRKALGLTVDSPVVVVGAGNLGRALANYGGFGRRGFPVVAIVDSSPDMVGLVLGDITVRDITELDDIIAASGPVVGIIATPAAAAQEVADRLVAAGASAILNFASVLLSTPDTVPVRQVDLALELQILSFYQHQAATTG